MKLALSVAIFVALVLGALWVLNLVHAPVPQR